MKPTIGRIVYFVNPFGDGREVFAAIITNVLSNEVVNLQVFYDGSNFSVPADCSRFASSVKFDEGFPPGAGTWHWPPRA